MQHNDWDHDDNITRRDNSDCDTARGMATTTMQPHSLTTVPMTPRVAQQQRLQHHVGHDNSTCDTHGAKIR
jgi:hypothetical protein